MKSAWIMLSGLAVVVTLATGAATASRWDKVPAKDHDRTNPLAGNFKAVEGGAGIYKDHCAQCHGADAMGDGKKKPALKSDEIKNATDGDLEWFLRQGELRGGMPSWSNLPRVQRWQVVTYLRSLQQ